MIHHAPIVLLVRPQMGENIGAVARAMSNFGLSELRLCAPRKWPNDKALEMAAGAKPIIESAKVYPDFRSAMADIQFAYATTARPRDMEKRVLGPDAAMEEIAQRLKVPLPNPLPQAGEGTFLSPLSEGGRVREGDLKIALVFGPERTGLENEEIILCDTLITIPTAKNYSLNLGQSAVVLGYEWHRHSVKSPDILRELPEMAPREDWQGLFDQLESYLDTAEHFRTPQQKPVMWQNLQNMLLRGQYSSQEVRTFRGMLRGLWERRIGKN